MFVQVCIKVKLYLAFESNRKQTVLCFLNNSEIVEQGFSTQIDPCSVFTTKMFPNSSIGMIYWTPVFIGQKFRDLRNPTYHHNCVLFNTHFIKLLCKSKKVFDKTYLKVHLGFPKHLQEIRKCKIKLGINYNKRCLPDLECKETGNVPGVNPIKLFS